MSEPSLTFWEHLEELRWTIMRIAIAALVAMIVIFIAMPHVFTTFVLGPTTSDFFLYRWLGSLGQLPFLPDFAAGDFRVEIININVASQFMTHVSTSFWFALVAIFPYMRYPSQESHEGELCHHLLLHLQWLRPRRALALPAGGL